MHIILAILGALGAAGMIIWRISIAIQAARAVGDAAEGIVNLPRKMRFQSRAKKSGVQMIAVAREAATLLMLSVARAGGEVTASQKAVIRGQMTARFELSEQEAEEMLTHVAWLSRDLPEPGSAIGRMVELLRKQVTPDELRELAVMLDLVANADGDPAPAQVELMQAYQRATAP